MNIEQLPIGKHTIEINIVGDGRAFLNFWDYVHGNDVIAEIHEGKLWYTPEGEELPHTISINEYLKKVAESINKRTI